MCGTENHARVNTKDFDKETIIDSKCDDCDVVSELTVRMKPYLYWLDVK